MKRIRKLVSTILITALTFTLTACGGAGKQQVAVNNTASSESTSASADPLKVQVEVEVASMDPQIATDGTSFEVLRTVNEGLYRVNEEGIPKLAMAENVEKSEDGLTYTFKLREAKWSDGTPVTAKDFVFAWRRLVDPKTASEYAFMGDVAGIKNAAAVNKGEVPVEQLGVTAKDDKTLEVQLDIPVPFFESLMAFPSFLPVNEEFYKKCGDEFATSVDTILSNGPYKMTSYEPAATTVSVEKNPDYWDKDNVNLSGIQFQVIKDTQQAMLAYQNGDVDLATLSGEQVEQFKNDPEYQNTMAGFLWYIVPNMKVPGLENANLRTALALSFDKNAVVNNILKDGSIPADFAVPKSLAVDKDGKDFRDSTGTYLSTDKAKALDCYNKAKQELGKDNFSFTMIVEDTESAQNVAQFIQSEIQNTLPGVTISLEVMPKKNRVSRMEEGDFELGLTRWGPDYADPMTYLDMWVTNGSNNYGFWSNPEYDSIIQSAKKGELALDVDARWEALKKAEKMVMDDAVIFPIYQKADAIMLKKNVSHVLPKTITGGKTYKDAVKK